MKVFIVGGGPAGLCAAVLLKRQDPTVDITVVDRGQPTETYGWGITLPRRTIAQLETADPIAGSCLRNHVVTWSRNEVHHRGRRVEITWAPIFGVPRLALLGVLQERCVELGVTLQFGTTIESACLPEADLTIAADGANSALRGSRADAFGTSLQVGLNRYIWLGTPHLFSALTLAVAENDDGVFVGHAYPFSSDASTFIVECRVEVWERAGLGARSSADVCEYLATLFAESLNGCPLLHRGTLRWASFTRVKNERWHDGGLVLIGDAAHAIHFSVGSGTMLAIEDALALAESFREHSALDAALDAYEQKRKAAVQAFHALEDITINRLERMHEFTHLEPLELAYRLMSR